MNASSYIVSVVLVLIVGALVGVLATVSHHLHHRRLLLHEPASASILHHHRHHHHRHHHHHHHREELPASHQRRLLLQDHHRHPGTPVSNYLFSFCFKIFFFILLFEKKHCLSDCYFLVVYKFANDSFVF